MLQEIIHFQNWFNDDSFYWFCALAGSGLFIIQFCLNFIGFADHDTNDGMADAGAFKWLSRQAITGFLMMFGWSALTSQNEFNLDWAPTLAIAILSGLIAIFVTGLIFKTARKLHSNGTVFKIEDTIGLEAVVYQRIPSDGIGKISVCIEDFIREIDACSGSHKEVPSFVRVKIINKINDNTVLVEML